MLKNIFFLLFSISVFGQNKSVSFVTSSWKEIIVQAQKINKPIYVDFYTTWCGPCKTMERQFFSDSTVAKIMNANFVNVRIDAEAGEGIELSKKYAITAYPSSLFLTPEGTVFSRMIGYPGLKKGIGELNKAIDVYKTTASKSLNDLEVEFQTGNNNLNFINSYFDRKVAVGQSVTEQKDLYFSRLSNEEKGSAEIIRFLIKSPILPKTKVFDFLINVIKQDGTKLPIETHGALKAGMNEVTNEANSFNDFTKIRLANDVSKLMTDFQKQFYVKKGFGKELITQLDEQLHDDTLSRNLTFFRVNKRNKELDSEILNGLKLIDLNKTSLKAKDELHTSEFNKRYEKYTPQQRASIQFKNFERSNINFESRKTANKCLELAKFYAETEEKKFIKKGIKLGLIADDIIETTEGLDFLIIQYKKLNNTKKANIFEVRKNNLLKILTSE